MNYLIAWLLCMATTVLTTLGGNSDWHWLLISDANVTIFLALAYYIEKWRTAPTVLNIRASSVNFGNDAHGR